MPCLIARTQVWFLLPKNVHSLPLKVGIGPKSIGLLEKLWLALAGNSRDTENTENREDDPFEVPWDDQIFMGSLKSCWETCLSINYIDHYMYIFDIL